MVPRCVFCGKTRPRWVWFWASVSEEKSMPAGTRQAQAAMKKRVLADFGQRFMVLIQRL